MATNKYLALRLEQIKRQWQSDTDRVVQQLTEDVGSIPLGGHPTGQKLTQRPRQPNKLSTLRTSKHTDKNQDAPGMSRLNEIDFSDVATNAATSAPSNKTIGLATAPKRILVEANSSAASKRQAIDVTIVL